MAPRFMAGAFTAAMAGFLVAGTFAQDAAKEPESLDSLQKRIAAVIDQPRYHSAMWGVKIVSLDTGKVMFERNADKLFSPASNAKLYTMALALDRLGADYRIKTSLYARGKPTGEGVLQGDLLIYGRGDPTINARLHGGDIYPALEPLAAALTNAGVKQITGDLVGDDSYFHGPPYGSGWSWDDLQYYYGAEISALTINDNTLQVRVKPGETIGAACRLSLFPATGYITFSNRTQTIAKGKKRSINLYHPPAENVIYVSGQLPVDDAGYADDVTTHNPAGLFATFFKESLARHGITISGVVRAMNWKDREAAPLDLKQWVELGAMESPPMRDIVREVQKPSQNLYADLTLAQVGAKFAPAGAENLDQTTEEAGVKALNTFLAEVDVPKGETFFEEGSGLSRDDLTTPNATATLLAFMARHKSAEIYINALPVAGVDGTLKNRMKGTPAAGNLKAKTGSLGWAGSLSGYVTTAAGERLVFSLMLNRFHNADPNHSKTADLDAIAVMVAGFTGHTEKPVAKTR